MPQPAKMPCGDVVRTHGDVGRLEGADPVAIIVTLELPTEFLDGFVRTPK